MFETGINTSKV